MIYINRINNLYINEVINEFTVFNPMLISYGSNIYTDLKSDMDICFILDDNCINKKLVGKLIEFNINFHIKYALPIDDEISFENKLVYFDRDVISLLYNNPFMDESGYYHISPIKKEKNFLESNAMRLRLLLNILTSDHLLLLGDKRLHLCYENMAWGILLKSLIRAYNIKNIDVEHLYSALHRHPYTGEMYKEYLGYDINNKNKRDYILSKLKYYIDTIKFY